MMTIMITDNIVPIVIPTAIGATGILCAFRGPGPFVGSGVSVDDPTVELPANIAYPAGWAFKNAAFRSFGGQVPVVHGLDLQQPKNDGTVLPTLVHFQNRPLSHCWSGSILYWEMSNAVGTLWSKSKISYGSHKFTIFPYWMF
jgi:hypothetical protein